MLLEEIANGGDVSRFLRAYTTLQAEDRSALAPLVAPKWGFFDWLSMRTPPLIDGMAQVARVCGSTQEWERVLAAQEHVITKPDFCDATRTPWPLPDTGLLWGTVALLMVRKQMPPEDFAKLYDPWESMIPLTTITGLSTD